jgi:hypothetical protein
MLVPKTNAVQASSLLSLNSHGHKLVELGQLNQMVPPKQISTTFKPIKRCSQKGSLQYWLYFTKCHAVKIWFTAVAPLPVRTQKIPRNTM